MGGARVRMRNDAGSLHNSINHRRVATRVDGNRECVAAALSRRYDDKSGKIIDGRIFLLFEPFPHRNTHIPYPCIDMTLELTYDDMPHSQSTRHTMFDVDLASASGRGGFPEPPPPRLSENQNKSWKRPPLFINLHCVTRAFGRRGAIRRSACFLLCTVSK